MTIHLRSANSFAAFAASLYLFINVVDIGSNIRLFADDTSLYMVVDNPDTAAELLNLDINKIMTWAKKWLVTFNPVKTASLFL